MLYILILGNVIWDIDFNRVSGSMERFNACSTGYA